MIINVFSKLERLSRLWSNIALAVGFVFICVLALMGSLDVFLTYLFNRPIKGAIEISSSCYAAAVFLGLPAVQRASQHITVDLLIVRLSSRWKKICLIFALLCTLVFLAYLSTRIWLFATESLAMLEVDSGVLMFPVYPFKTLAFFGVIGAALEAGRQFFELILTNRVSISGREQTFM